MMFLQSIFAGVVLGAADSPQADAAQHTTGKTIYEFGRLHAVDDERWLIVGLIAAVLAGVAFVWIVYRRDGVELRPWVARLCFGLRITALALLVLFFLDPQRRVERTSVQNSRVVLMVDVSQSMGMHDAEEGEQSDAPSRLDRIVSALKASPFLGDLRREHDVVVTRFDRETSRITSLKKTGVTTRPEGSDAADNPSNDDLPDTAGHENATADKTAKTDWLGQLVPQGTETRLGEALRSVLHEQQDGPVAGVIVLTDGAQNAGAEVDPALETAKEAKIPIYTIGMGSAESIKNVRVSDFVAPPRAFPSDGFTVTGFVQSSGLSGRSATIELLSRRVGESEQNATLIDSQRVLLGGDDEVKPVKFEISANEPGRYTYLLRIRDLNEDRIAADNQQQVDVEIVPRRTHVLLLASGPTREYQFLRNQLRRDKDMVVDVLLQSAHGAISQDANQVLDNFPDSKDALFDYDCIVAFDVDWSRLDSVQIGLLEEWVADQAGGLILVAGPLHTGHWPSNASLEKVLSLYPVEFQQRLTALDDAEYGGKTPWPIVFSREGLEAEFLWLDDTADASQDKWQTFPGVYGYYAVKRAKPGATVYGRYGDPQAAVADEMPVYLAAQFYGSGRVFYTGSGEMWRLRALDDAYFESLYTKLIRHVSQGRLLRDSSRGVLLVERDRYSLGDVVVVRAQLSNALHEPLDLPSANAHVERPDGSTFSVKMMPDRVRAGSYTGQFTALAEGAYRIGVTVPGSVDEQLSRRIQVKLPDLERQNSRRNDPLLSRIARTTGGAYYVGLNAALGASPQATEPIAAQLVSREEITSILGAPDKAFRLAMMKFLLLLICGALCLEWVVRRICKLA